MNSELLLSKLGFECQELDAETLRIWSPFSYGTDGEQVGVFVERQGQRIHVSDNAEALMHASAIGATLSDGRVDAVRRAVPSDVSISRGGVISTTVDEANWHEGVVAVVNAAMAIGHFESNWMPRTRSEPFAKSVGKVLQEELGARLLRDFKVVGASGHQLELPFAFKAGLELVFVQPVAADDAQVNWTNVYASFGKMIDLKNAGAEAGTRVVVLEDSRDDAEQPNAISILASSATVVQFPGLRQWVQRRVA